MYAISLDGSHVKHVRLLMHCQAQLIGPQGNYCRPSQSKAFIAKTSMITKKNLLLLFVLCVSCLTNQSVMAQSSSEELPKKLEYQLIKATENTLGYDIMMNGKLFIHQPFAPGISGNRGFSSKEKAEWAAKLVIEKINNGIMPPSLSVDEVKQIENKK
jgi:hypothetical protein